MSFCGTDLQLCPPLLKTIDLDAPWLVPWRAIGAAVLSGVANGKRLSEALNQVAQTLQHVPVSFVPQSELPTGVAYEQHIFDTACVPTRDGLHDFFNGLAWLQFPLTKARQNRLHVTLMARNGIAPVRGPARDALTLFDENAALLQAPDVLWNALVAKDWHTVFVDLRSRWQDVHLLLFGHALLEKLVAPRKAMTAHVYRVQAVGNSLADLDAWVAHDLSAEKLAAKPFAHLPVLGVPGWWAPNQNPAFYSDTSVFRPPRA